MKKDKKEAFYTDNSQTSPFFTNFLLKTPQISSLWQHIPPACCPLTACWRLVILGPLDIPDIIIIIIIVNIIIIKITCTTTHTVGCLG